MSAKKPTPQKNIPASWKTHHESLNNSDKEIARLKIMAGCEWSLATFYVKMKTPEGLKHWEKQIVAAAYSKTVNYLFPEKKEIIKRMKPVTKTVAV